MRRGDRMDHELKFCPCCAGTLEPREVEERERLVCSSCEYVFYLDPKLAVAVVLPFERGILLGRRAIDPRRGYWSFPSGYVDRGEVVEVAARREVLEETGLEVELDGLVGLYSDADSPVVLAVYAAHVVGGAAQAGHEVLELGVYPPDALPEMAFPHDSRIIEDWRRLLSRGHD